MPKYFKAGCDLKLRQLTSPESCLANDIGRMAWYHNTNRLATAHSLGMMPDYMRGRTCFNQITGLVKVKWLDSSDQFPQEKIKDTNTKWDVCLAMPTPRQLGLPAGLEKVDPSTLFGGLSATFQTRSTSGDFLLYGRHRMMNTRAHRYTSITKQG